MDEGGAENRRHRVEFPKVSPWNLMSHYQTRDQNAMHMHAKLSMLYDEKDAAIKERDRALAEKNAALGERDAAIKQRDAAIIERDNVLMERDNAVAALQFHESTMTAIFSMRGSKRTTDHHQPNPDHNSLKEECTSDTFPTSLVPFETPTSKKGRRTKTNKKNVEFQLPKKISEDLNRQVTTKAEWDAEDVGSRNQIWFDESSMQVPVCSCTGVPRQCYKWGNGGWQSSCCTTSLSVYPLPQMPNKRHARMGGRKMSGSVFSRLLTRMAAAGHDLSVPLDLKSYWAKHGTNRYITIK